MDYNNSGKSEPTDFDSPNPVPFLSVDGKFRFALSLETESLGTCSALEEILFRLAIKILVSALSDFGIGGKTSSGYGRLLSEEERQRAAISPHSSLSEEKQAQIQKNLSLLSEQRPTNHSIQTGKVKNIGKDIIEFTFTFQGKDYEAKVQDNKKKKQTKGTEAINELKKRGQGVGDTVKIELLSDSKGVWSVKPQWDA